MKKKTIFKEWRHWPTDRLSGFVLVVLIVLSVLVLGAFYLIGFDRPFEEDANFNAPLFTDVLLYLMYGLVAVAIGVCLVAVYRSFKMRNGSGAEANGIPASRISYGTAGLLVGCLVLTFLFGSSQPMKINGEKFEEVFWLKATDMFINTSIVLIVIAVMAVAAGLSGYFRRHNDSKGGNNLC